LAFASPHSGLSPPSYRPCRAHIKIEVAAFSAATSIFLLIFFYPAPNNGAAKNGQWK